jgi:membrane-bound ClpP family serine protease
VVIADIAPGVVGSVRVDSEEWRASASSSEPIPAGTAVRISEVEGPRVIVVPTKEHTS